MAQRIKPLHSILKNFRVERKAISKIRFILEAYEGIAVVETMDPRAALIRLHIAPGCENIVDNVLSELNHEYFIEPAEAQNTCNACVENTGGTSNE